MMFEQYAKKENLSQPFYRGVLKVIIHGQRTKVTATVQRIALFPTPHRLIKRLFFKQRMRKIHGRSIAQIM